MGPMGDGERRREVRIRDDMEGRTKIDLSVGGHVERDILGGTGQR